MYVDANRNTGGLEGEALGAVDGGLDMSRLDLPVAV